MSRCKPPEPSLCIHPGRRGPVGGSHGRGEWLCCRGTAGSRRLAPPAMVERAEEGLPEGRRGSLGTDYPPCGSTLRPGVVQNGVLLL